MLESPLSLLFLLFAAGTLDDMYYKYMYLLYKLDWITRISLVEISLDCKRYDIFHMWRYRFRYVCGRVCYVLMLNEPKFKSCSNQYPTSERSERVRYRFEQSKRNFYLSAQPCIILWYLFTNFSIFILLSFAMFFLLFVVDSLLKIATKIFLDISNIF